MKFFKPFLICFALVSSTALLYGQKQKTPIMGWSSWNNFRVNIDEKMIREQADALVSSGLYEAGYRFINIDDGYFGGRDSSGKLFVDGQKFPSGMKSLADYIHSKGLKAGIYTDAGKNTCGSIYDKDTKGIGVGIYGHIQRDCNLFFKEWGYDFLKVDWCGGQQMKLDERTEYLKIIDTVKAINPDIVFNICRWQFPGTWAIKKADSWRISGDIREQFSSILKIIDFNADLYKYASPGHYNDMDMLQVGRGMSYEEDKTHFSMWCMLNSPLLAGNDLRNMSKQTVEILTNKEIIALNQDSGYVQAKKMLREKNVEVWMKPLGTGNKQKAIAIMNRGEEEIIFTLNAQRLGISSNSKLRDLWLHKDLGTIGKEQIFTIPKHGIVVLKVLNNTVANAGSKNSGGKVLKMVAEHRGPVISADHPDVLASGNRSGFETGQVVKQNGVYHMFVNEMFDRPHRDLRISYWTSNDAVNWKRQSTIVNSIPGRTPFNPRSEVWVTGVVFNEDEDAWNIFYVAYRAGDSTRGEIAGNDYEGRIWRAKSVIKGRDGIAGPYADMGILMEPDENSQPWEGQQAVACFNPYKVGNTWFSMYDGHYHTPRGPWPTGIAFAKSLNGPWTRMPEGFNPIPVVDVFMENEIVYKLKDGRYLMIFDSFGDQEIGYSLSEDGVNWSKEIRVKVQSAQNLWAEAGDHFTRTPLCAIEEADGTFTVVYTAMTKINGKNFYAIGKCSLAWQ